MPYFQGFVTPVPTARHDAFAEHAMRAAALMREFGASRVVDTWGTDVPDGTVNDFKTAVAAKPDETVSFSWIEFPDAAAAKVSFDTMMSDPRMEDLADMPFDGKRMIYGGFEPLMDEGTGLAGAGYIDGFIIPVPKEKRDAFRDMALTSWTMFRDHGARRQVEAWGVSVPRGEVTDFYRAAHAQEDENVVFAFLEWPDKATRDAGMKAVMEDERMKTMPSEMPFDGKRMIFGGFSIL